MTDPLFERLQSALSPAFALDRELKGGGMSRVFVATERALDRRVVIKLLPPELAAGVNTERFRREIQLAAQLHHPHIVPLFTTGEVDGLLYYTMPYIEGESLRERLASGKQSAPREVLRILHDVVDALAYAHKRGIVHRDIKPGNILTLGSHALVTDFGVAKALSAALPMSGVTTGGVAIGSPAYMAPEQLAGDPTADHRMDIYAVGLLGYELLAGSSPFTGPSPQATMAAQLTRVPEPIDSIRGDVPASLSAILSRCLEKSPAARYASAEELLAALDTVDLGSGATAAFTVRRSRKATVAIAAVALLGAAGAGMAANAILGRHHQAPVVLDTRGGEAVPSVVLIDTMAAPAAPPPTRVITRAESLAIARSVREQLQEQTAPSKAQTPTHERDRIAGDLERMIADSIRVALEKVRTATLRVPRPPEAPVAPRTQQHAAASAAAGVAAAAHIFDAVEGRSLVAIPDLNNATGQAQYADAARQIGDSLRVIVDRHTRFLLVPRLPTAVRAGGEPPAELPRGFTVNGMIHMVGGRLTHMVRIEDRSGRVVGIITGPAVNPDQPLSGARELSRLLIAQLEQLDSPTPRRGPIVTNRLPRDLTP